MNRRVIGGGSAQRLWLMLVLILFVHIQGSWRWPGLKYLCNKISPDVWVKMWNAAGNKPEGIDKIGPDVWVGGGETSSQGMVVLGAPVGHNDYITEWLQKLTLDHKKLFERICSKTYSAHGCCYQCAPCSEQCMHCAMFHQRSP